jgi:pSer/pThr/pTyr-binding forkhead associated (FHA) protein
VLDDPSISRQHAQLRLAATADRFTVLDLRSSNGTFVDGQKTKRAECTDGSIVRFGDIAFKVKLIHEKSGKPKRRMGRRTLWILAAMVVLLLVAVGVVAKIMQPKPPPPDGPSGPTIDKIQAEVQREVEQGKRKLSQRDWSAAIVAFEHALALDPINEKAKNLRQQAITERQFKQAFIKANEYFGLGNKENLLRAKDVYRTIPASSVYHRDVRYRLRTINERLADEYRTEGLSRCKARYWAKCQRALCRFFELLPEGKVVPGESQLRRRLSQVEARLKRGSFAPCEAQRFLNPSGEEAPGESPAEVLAEKYQVSAIKDAMMLYFGGRIENALRKIQILSKSRKMRPHLAVIREINRQLLIIRGKYQEGYSAFRERNVADADRHWGIVLDADDALIPRRIESFYRREVKRALGDLYFELGHEEFKLMRYRQAYAHWSRGKQVNAAHERILNGMLQLEAVAEKLIKRGRRLGSTAEGRKLLTMAKDITEEGRPTHREAVKLLAE